MSARTIPLGDAEAAPHEDPAQRYRLLVESIGDELGRARGWKAAAAKRLGVHPSMISRCLRGALNGRVSGRTLDRASAGAGIRRSYFTAPGPADIAAHRVGPARCDRELLAWMDAFIARAGREMAEPRLRDGFLKEWATKKAEMEREGLHG